MAALDPLFPVWAIASRDETLPAVLEAAARASARPAPRSSRAVTPPSAIAGADYVLPVPMPPRRCSRPLLSVVPGQLFAVALARGEGPRPRPPGGLSKVTLAT